MSGSRGRALVGTSGFSYPHWRGVFYPKEVPQRDHLRYYAERFPTVELNVTFYRLPEEDVFQRWAELTPPDFVFSLKGSRYVTHVKRLKDPDDAVALLMQRASPLEDRLECVLWQLPANFRADVERLERFAVTLRRRAPSVRHALEFRHDSWFAEDVYDILRGNGHALCIAHSDRWPRREVVTAGFTYLRFHGDGTAYDSGYSGEELSRWAEKVRGWLDSGTDTYTYFNNDIRGHAVRDAARLASLIGTRRAPEVTHGLSHAAGRQSTVAGGGRPQGIALPDPAHRRT